MPPPVTRAAAPPDPAWRPLALPGWDLAYLAWPLRPDGEAGPPAEAISALAQALGGSATVVFLADAAAAPQAIAAPAALRRQGAPARIGLVATRSPATIATLFDQPGFDWTQRGQLVFLLPPGAEACVPEDILAAMADDPPRRLPPACLGLLRPGTDGDFAELATRDAALRDAVLNGLA